MSPVSVITPGVLAAIAADWSEAELHAAAAVLVSLLHDRKGSVSGRIPPMTPTAQDRAR